MGIHISRIKSLKLDNWEISHVQTMENNGNCRSNVYYERNVPLYYRRPNPHDPQYVNYDFFYEPIIDYHH